MASYLARRILYSIAVLWGVATLVFLLFHVLPADPARLTLGQRSDLASVEAARKELHLDKPLTTRYWLFLRDISPLGIISESDSRIGSNVKLLQQTDGRWLVLKAPDLGRSYRSKRPVSEILAQGLPGTFMLAGAAMLLATIFGILLGVLAALKKGTAFDTGAIAASVAGVSLPSFFAALIIAYVFGYLLGDYTGLGMTGSLYEYDAFEGQRIVWKNLILPAVALGIRPMAIIAQLTRSALLDVLSQDYIRTGYAKGLSKSRVVWRHALPNAMNPILTAISGWLAELLAGSFFIEYLFGWKGIGKITVDALEKFDFPLVMGAVLFSAVILIVVNLVTDILYGVLDPRVRL